MKRVNYVLLSIRTKLNPYRKTKTTYIRHLNMRIRPYSQMIMIVPIPSLLQEQV
jgi:hypothetical protein